MKDFLGACLLGAVLGAMLAYGVPAKAQTVAITNAQGNTVGYFQQAWGTVNTLDANGRVIAPPLTVQPNQLTAPNGFANSYAQVLILLAGISFTLLTAQALFV